MELSGREEGVLGTFRQLRAREAAVAIFAIQAGIN